MRYRLLCGISYRFQQLSPAKRQVTYALLTRSQLIRSVQAPSFSVLLACIRHAASVHPEPGSNSPLSFYLFRQLWSVQLFFCFLFISKLSLTLCFILSCSVFNVLSLVSLVECPFILPSSLPFVKLFLVLFLFFSLFLSFSAFISTFFPLIFFYCFFLFVVYIL